VLITHHHIDHVGPLSRLAAEGVTVWAHPADAAVIRGGAPEPAPASRNTLERAGVWSIQHLGPRRASSRVDRELADGEEIPIGDGVIACHTPGHTAGHMSFLMPSKRVLFVGDAAANYLGKLGPPVGIYNEDHDEVRKSIAKLAALDFDVACFGHGRTLKGDACAAFRRLAEKVAS
jgi:glyoxylase-like metal-dependent hydrolase (beta-lactamase superfamily II)